MANDSAHILHLWQQMIEGDKDSLGELFDILGKEMIAYAHKISTDRSIAKDAVQDVFVDLWQYRSNLSQDVQVRFYLYRSVKRAVLRNIKWMPSVLDDVEHFADTVNVASVETEFCEIETEQQQQLHIEQSLQLLSQREREIITLKYYSNLKLKDIAALLELKEQTIANTLQNALTKLRKNLIHLLILLVLKCLI